LQNAGYEAYIVGGAVRDFLLGRKPKDYDLATSATPEQVKAVFRKRHCIIIGRRFRLVHLYWQDEIIEISTFRQCPANEKQKPVHERKIKAPDKMIFRDNDFGTSQEDAFRRDFTINALFYDPVHDELFDYTGKGLEDAKARRIRVIGDAPLRFEEDPVRMLRALKLRAQYGFDFHPVTENALKKCMPLIVHASVSRMTLELEKILVNPYGDSILRVFHEYGLLVHFLPELEKNFDSPQGKYAMRIFALRCERMRRGLYRDSISLAYACLTLPFFEAQCNPEAEPGNLWQPHEDIESEIRSCLLKMFKPHQVIHRVSNAAVRNIMLQPALKERADVSAWINHPVFGNAKELSVIQNELVWHIENFDEIIPAVKQKRNPRKQKRNPAKKKNTKSADSAAVRKGTAVSPVSEQMPEEKQTVSLSEDAAVPAENAVPLGDSVSKTTSEKNKTE